MDDKSFDTPITVTLDGAPRAVASVRAASEMLMSVDWPGARDDRHAEAVDTCLKVLDGHRSTEDARAAFSAAAGDAGILGG